MLDTSPGFAMYSSVPNVATADEADLIRNVLAGRRDLFGALIASHLKPLSRMVRAAVGIHTDVEDVVQQTVLKALLHLDQFRFKASFRTWLIRIGINEARQWQRKSSSARLRTADLAGVSDFHATDDISSPLALCQRDQAITRLRAAFARLPDEYRSGHPAARSGGAQPFRSRPAPGIDGPRGQDAAVACPQKDGGVPGTVREFGLRFRDEAPRETTFLLPGM